MYDSQEELLEKISLGEDSTFEYKAVKIKGNKIEGPERNDLADEFSAFANSSGGVFIFGVNDKTKGIEGIPYDKLDIVERYIAEIASDSIKPQLDFHILRMKLPDDAGEMKPIIKVFIPKSLFVHQSPRGYFRRNGSRKQALQPDVLARLFQQRSQTRLIRFDEQAVAEASLETLNQDLWKRFKTNLSPEDNQEFLLKIKLITKTEEGIIRPSVSGLLIASNNPERHIPSAYIQAVHYRGMERDGNYQLDAKDICGPVDLQIKEACQFVEKNMNVRAIKAPARQDMPQFSMNAVFEAIVNAVAHRDYSIYGSKIRLHLFADRLEIFSPGAIPNTMTIESLPLRQAVRNELLTSLLARCPINVNLNLTDRKFLMDKRGEGVPIILNASEKLSGKKPQYKLLDDTELLLTIYAAEIPERDKD